MATFMSTQTLEVRVAVSQKHLPYVEITPTILVQYQQILLQKIAI